MNPELKKKAKTDFEKDFEIQFLEKLWQKFV